MGTDWTDIFQKNGAIWIHDGKKSRPHALLTSGLHSDGFVNCTYITQQPVLLQSIVAGEDGLAPMIPVSGIDWVIGSAFGAITLAHAVALRIGCRAGFTEKDDGGMKLSRFEVAPGSRVLIVEDTISTGGSTLKTIDGVKAAGVSDSQILPWILCLVNRSGEDRLGGREIRSLLRPTIHMWKPEDCPLCREGSQPVRPKAHWAELTK